MKVVVPVFSLIVVVAAVLYFSDVQFATLLPYSSSSTVPVAPPAAEPRLPPPNLQALAAGLQGGDSNESVEEDSIVAEQVQAAREELRSANVDTRIGALEQLAAYPTPESERLMVDILRTDSDDDVRVAATNALSSIRNPSQESVSALSLASIDLSDTIRQSALTTLDVFLNREPYASPRSKIILHELGLHLKKRTLPADARQDILEFINDHKS